MGGGNMDGQIGAWANVIEYPACPPVGLPTKVEGTCAEAPAAIDDYDYDDYDYDDYDYDDYDYDYDYYDYDCSAHQRVERD
jgi:hypothetical protein